MIRRFRNRLLVYGLRAKVQRESFLHSAGDPPGLHSWVRVSVYSKGIYGVICCLQGFQGSIEIWVQVSGILSVSSLQRGSFLDVVSHMVVMQVFGLFKCLWNCEL